MSEIVARGTIFSNWTRGLTLQGRGLAHALFIVSSFGLALSQTTPARAAFPGPNGKIAFASTRDGIQNIYTMNFDGSGPTRITNTAASEGGAAWSPDATRIAFNRFGNFNSDIWVMNPDGTGQTQVTNNPAHDFQAAWSPDGSQIAFVSDRDGNREIYVMNADGTAQTNLSNNAAGDFEPAWSPDGTKIAFTSERAAANNLEIYVMKADGTNQTRLTNSSGVDNVADWSPDGIQIAFASNRSGNHDVYVMNADGTAQTPLTNNSASDVQPAWSPDGTKIAFMSDRDGNTEIYVMNADGTAQTNLSNDPDSDSGPAWGSLVPPFPGPSVDKSVNPTTVPAPGGPGIGDVTYTVSVTHHTDALQPVTVVALVDDTYGDLNGSGTCATGAILDPGDTYSCSFAGVVSGSIGSVHRNTVTGTVQDGDGNRASDIGSATVTVVAPTAKVTPAFTTCQMFRGGTASDLNSVSYAVQAGKISTVSGQLFYYSKIQAPNTNFTIDMAQTRDNAAFPLFGVRASQTGLLNASCIKSSKGTVTIAPDGNVVHVAVSGAALGEIFYVAVMYNPGTVVGTPVARPYPTVMYRFATYAGGDLVPSSRESVLLKPR